MAINPREERRRDNENGSDGEEESVALLHDCDLIGRERTCKKKVLFGFLGTLFFCLKLRLWFVSR